MKRARLGAAGLVAGLMLWAHAPREPLPDGVRATRIVVDKSDRRLSLYDGGRLLRQ